MVVMLIKLIMACHGHKEMKIIMPHKIQIMDIDQAFRNNELVMMTILVGMITDLTIIILIRNSKHWL